MATYCNSLRRAERKWKKTTTVRFQLKQTNTHSLKSDLVLLRVSVCTSVRFSPERPAGYIFAMKM